MAALLLLLWFLKGALFPFLLAAAIAYFLDPVADMLERWGCHRLLAVTIILLVFLLLALPVGVFLVLSLTSQVTAFLSFVPNAAAAIQACLANDMTTIALLQQCLREDATVQASAGATGSPLELLMNFDIGVLWNMISQIVTKGGPFLTRVVSATVSALSSSVSMLIVVPVVMAYLLADWDLIIAKIRSWLPHDHADEISGIISDIDDALSGFVRRQLVVCALMAMFYAGSLMFAGLQYGLVIGCVAGLVSFIPIFGAVLGLAMGMGVAVFQFWQDPIWIGAVAAIFLVGQVLEGYVLTPRLVGSRIKLHPVWLLFALSAFYGVFGIVGALVAVPAAAAIGVLFRYGVGRYLNSRLYLGATALRSDEAND
ncbi:MAG: AI-2E family transporter [Rhodobacteraceae bacterium]|nr:AI-2E family transporter [Paracoccaceae bacterium]